MPQTLPLDDLFALGAQLMSLRDRLLKAEIDQLAVRALQDERDRFKAERDELRKGLDSLVWRMTEIGALEAERDDLRKIVEMVHADLGIQPGDHIGEAISELKKEASDATARQRMTEVRALKYSAQAEDARREIERLRSEVESLRAKLNAKTVEWPEWARDGARVVVKSCDSYHTDASIGFEFVIAEIDRGDSTVGDGKGTWASIFDLEPVAEHVAPPVVVATQSATQTPEETAPVVSPKVGDKVRLVKRPELYREGQWSDVWGIVGQEGKMTGDVHHVFLKEPYILVSTQGKGESLPRLREWPVSCVEVVK